MFGLEFLALGTSFVAAVDACWARRQRTIFSGKSGSEMPGLYRPRVKDLAWAVTVGGSVTLRLVCAVQLSTFHASVRGTTLAASCWVSALSSLLSFLCLFSFLPRSVNLRNEEISELATITGALALPAFLVIAAVDLFGLSFAQLILLLVAVLSAALTADSGKVRAQGWKFLVLAVGAGLLGIAGGWGPSMNEDLSKYCGPLVALLVAGASAVVQGRFLVADRAVPYKTESSYELMCLFVAAAAHVPFVLVFLLSGDSFRMPRLADAHQWAFMAMQGVFYIRSLRPLTATLGTVCTSERSDNAWQQGADFVESQNAVPRPSLSVWYCWDSYSQP